MEFYFVLTKWKPNVLPKILAYPMELLYPLESFHRYGKPILQSKYSIT